MFVYIFMKKNFGQVSSSKLSGAKERSACASYFYLSSNPREIQTQIKYNHKLKKIM